MATASCIQLDGDSNSIGIARLSVVVSLFPFHFSPKPLLAISGAPACDSIDRRNTVSRWVGNRVTVIVASGVAGTTRDRRLRPRRHFSAVRNR